MHIRLTSNYSKRPKCNLIYRWPTYLLWSLHEMHVPKISYVEPYQDTHIIINYKWSTFALNLCVLIHIYDVKYCVIWCNSFEKIWVYSMLMRSLMWTQIKEVLFQLRTPEATSDLRNWHAPPLDCSINCEFETEA